MSSIFKYFYGASVKYKMKIMDKGTYEKLKSGYVVVVLLLILQTIFVTSAELECLNVLRQYEGKTKLTAMNHMMIESIEQKENGKTVFRAQLSLSWHIAFVDFDETLFPHVFNYFLIMGKEAESQVKELRNQVKNFLRSLKKMGYVVVVVTNGEGYGEPERSRMFDLIFQEDFEEGSIHQVYRCFIGHLEGYIMGSLSNPIIVVSAYEWMTWSLNPFTNRHFNAIGIYQHPTLFLDKDNQGIFFIPRCYKPQVFNDMSCWKGLSFVYILNHILQTGFQNGNVINLPENFLNVMKNTDRDNKTVEEVIREYKIVGSRKHESELFGYENPLNLINQIESDNNKDFRKLLKIPIVQRVFVFSLGDNYMNDLYPLKHIRSKERNILIFVKLLKMEKCSDIKFSTAAHRLAQELQKQELAMNSTNFELISSSMLNE